MRIRGGLLSAVLIAATLATAQDAGAGSIKDGFRPYVHVRVGQSRFTDAESARSVKLESPATHPTFGGTIGANLNRVLGIELAGDYTKTELHSTAGSQLGDWSLATLLAQARIRYPLMDGYLVPYLLAGGGMGLGEFSGREDFTVDVGGSEIVPLAVIGAGAEYFVTDNIALGLEAKHLFWFSPDVRVGTRHENMQSDHISVTGGMRVYFDSLAGTLDSHRKDYEPPRDSDATRGYLALRVGKGLFTAGGGGEPGIDTVSGILGAGALGININEYFGAELASEYARVQVRSDSLGKISGYPIWTVLALARARYPVMDGRLSPYIVAGGGLGKALGGGDRDRPFADTGWVGSGQSTYVAALGAGFDYFLEDNVALNFEAKHTFLFETDVIYLGQPAMLDLDFVSLTGGIRIFFP